MKLRALVDKPEINLVKGNLYEAVDIILDTYKIKVDMKQKGKFRYALIKEDEGVLVDEPTTDEEDIVDGYDHDIY